MNPFGDLDKWLTELRDRLTAATTKEQLFRAAVDAPFGNPMHYVPLGLGLTVLLLVDKDRQTMDRIALSDTEAAQGAVDYSVKAFHDINIPLKSEENIIIKAYKTGEPQQTNDWSDTFVPILSPEEARFNQAGAGMASTVVYPLQSNSGGAFSFSLFKLLSEFTDEQHYFMSRYAALVDEHLARTFK